MNIVLLEHRWIDAELRRPTLYQRQCRLRAFAHDLAELPCQDHSAPSGHSGRLDEQNFSTHRCPSEPGRDTGDAGAQRDLAFKTGLTEHCREILSADGDLARAALR